MTAITLEDLVALYVGRRHLFEHFKNNVVGAFELEPVLNKPGTPIIHSIKSRLKDPSHLQDKLTRKKDDAPLITAENLFQRITDLAGVRILHLYQDQFPLIHNFIDSKIKTAEWIYVEQPIAYSWDPEATKFFSSVGLDVRIKDSFYTSVHYVVKPQQNSDLSCEIQVRTLFEEIWGEIDHSVNYPVPTQSAACREQLRVLSRLVSTGTRLADAIFRAHDQK